jgi:hypothetical protein
MLGFFFIKKNFFIYGLNEYNFQMLIVVLLNLLYSLNHSAKELGEKVIRIDTYHDTTQKYSCISILNPNTEFILWNREPMTEI